MNVEEMREKLKSVETITFSKHFYEPKVRLRGINESEVTYNIRNPMKLEVVEDQGKDVKGYKYGLLFHKSNKYDLKVVVSIKDKSLNVITSYVQNKRRRKVFEKWLRKLR